MANQNHLEILKDGVEVWNKWREANEHITPDLQKANLEKYVLDGANLTSTNLEGANLVETKLQKANFFAARLGGADLSWAFAKEANFEGALFDTKTRLSSADFSKSNLLWSKGLCFDETNILHARLAPRPGNFFNRFLNPFFIFNPVTDPWSELRRAYTGPNFLITLFALISFLLPYIFQIATWRTINLAQELAQENLVRLEEEYDDLLSRGIITSSTANLLGNTIQRLKGFETCLADECTTYRIWQLLIGVNRGWQFVALALTVIIYNAIRYNLTQTVAAFREEEERSGFTPALKEYFTPNALGLSPTRLHVVLRFLFLIATVAFLVNLYEVLFTVVKLKA